MEAVRHLGGMLHAHLLCKQVLGCDSWFHRHPTYWAVRFVSSAVNTTLRST